MNASKDFALTHYTELSNPKPCTGAFSFVNGLVDFSIKYQNPYIKSPFLYRGVGDSNHQLIPSALRSSHAQSFDLLWSIRSHSKPNENPSECDQRVAEFCVVREFFQYSDLAGLTLPPVTNNRRQQLFTGNPNFSEVTGNSPGLTGFQWPPDDLLGIIGLAQHYGLPTRLLDWSLSPFTAIYFAASSALSRLKNGSDPNSLFCVWILPGSAIDQHFYDQSNRMVLEGRLSGGFREEHPIRLVQPPTADNPNLRCQQGVFTVVMDRRDLNPRSTSDHPKPDRRPLDKIVSHYVEADTEAKSDRLKRSFELFQSCHLAIRHAPSVLRSIRQLGYSANRIFDGYQGAARAVEENADVIRQHVRIAKEKK